MDREDKLARFAALVERTEDLALKGKKTAYTAMNGNMFAFLSPEGTLAFRLAKARRAAFLEAEPEAVVIQYDTVMKDYVAIGEAWLENGEALAGLWEEVVANARGLEPKPTKRKAR